MMDVLNLALPYFGLIFIGFACGKVKNLPETGLAWMNFFLLMCRCRHCSSGSWRKTPFEELNNLPFVIGTTLATATAFFLSVGTGKFLGRLTMREAGMAGPRRRLRQYRLYGTGARAGGARPERRQCRPHWCSVSTASSCSRSRR